ncbi:hypothetical protein [Streptomyces sp. PTY087I2]|uniref:hypothetical protein n=1 Tax=Streptomyces sp. PTY087I2 TaxID=1819298 RepID=UPI00080BBD2E|nr:hypothetical protein [Streptomyces sp. PTY087I2]OCC09537.1 hypothetical protein A3Q37_04579 [Streptomyces sp. PTY087I2]
MAWLGFIWVLVILGTPVGIGAYVFYRRGGAGGAEHRRRARLIERDVRNYLHDNEVMDDVVYRIAQERQGYPRR